jgi:hypothetical protein
MIVEWYDSHAKAETGCNNNESFVNYHVNKGLFVSYRAIHFEDNDLAIITQRTDIWT